MNKKVLIVVISFLLAPAGAWAGKIVRVFNSSTGGMDYNILLFFKGEKKQVKRYADTEIPVHMPAHLSPNPEHDFPADDAEFLGLVYKPSGVPSGKSYDIDVTSYPDLKKANLVVVLNGYHSWTGYSSPSFFGTFGVPNKLFTSFDDRIVDITAFHIASVQQKEAEALTASDFEKQYGNCKSM